MKNSIYAGFVSSIAVCEATDALKVDNKTNWPQMYCKPLLYTVLDSPDDMTWCSIPLVVKKMRFLLSGACVKKSNGLKKATFLWRD